MKAVTALVGGSVKKSAATISPAPIAAVEEDKKKSKAARSALLETEGGILGSELTSGQVGRETLLGN